MELQWSTIKLITNPFDNRLINVGIFLRKKKVRILWLQLLKWEYVLVYWLLCDSKLIIFKLWTKHDSWGSLAFWETLTGSFHHFVIFYRSNEPIKWSTMKIIVTCSPKSIWVIVPWKLGRTFKSDSVCERASISRTRKNKWSGCGFVKVIRTPDVTVFQGETAGFILQAAARCPAPGLTDKHTDWQKSHRACNVRSNAFILRTASIWTLRKVSQDLVEILRRCGPTCSVFV